MLEPGGVSIDTRSSERSSIGTNPTPTLCHSGATRMRPTASARPATTPSSRTSSGRRPVTAHSITTMPARAARKPDMPFIGSVKEAKKAPTATTTIATRWSSAHAMTPL